MGRRKTYVALPGESEADRVRRVSRERQRRHHRRRTERDAGREAGRMEHSLDGVIAFVAYAAMAPGYGLASTRQEQREWRKEVEHQCKRAVAALNFLLEPVNGVRVRPALVKVLLPKWAALVYRAMRIHEDAAQDPDSHLDINATDKVMRKLVVAAQRCRGWQAWGADTDTEPLWSQDVTLRRQQWAASPKGQRVIAAAISRQRASVEKASANRAALEALFPPLEPGEAPFSYLPKGD